MELLPADVRMLINKFAWGSPTAKLIKNSPKWTLDLRMISADGEHFGNYEKEEDYWSDFTLNNEMSFMNEFEETDGFIEWEQRYLDKFF
jgi:hypothetical protein